MTALARQSLASTPGSPARNGDVNWNRDVYLVVHPARRLQMHPTRFVMSFVLTGILVVTFAASIATLVILYFLERDSRKFAPIRTSIDDRQA